MPMFIPGETICHRFQIPFMSTDVTEIIVSYYQNDYVILEKTVDASELEVEGGATYFTVQLTERESLMFQNHTSFRVQLNVLLTNGRRCTSEEIKGSNGIQHIRKEVIRNV